MEKVTEASALQIQSSKGPQRGQTKGQKVDQLMKKLHKN